MNKKKKKQNGFTIVELVIVIAVIGILAAVLIPTFTNLVKKAQKSADQQLVFHINEAVEANEGVKNGKEATMYDTLQALEEYGFTVEKMTPRSDDSDIVWDSTTNRFALIAKDGTILYTNPNKPTVDMSNKAQMWRITGAGESLDDGYSHYLKADWTGVVPDVSTGLDVGNNDDITSVTYKRSAGAEQTAVVRTNSFATTVTINAPSDTVNHYGNAAVVNVEAVAGASYHENGIVGRLTVESGHAVAEPEAIIFCFNNNGATETTPSTVEVKTGATVYNNDGEATGIEAVNTTTETFKDDCGAGHHDFGSQLVIDNHVYEVCKSCGYTLVHVVDEITGEDVLTTKTTSEGEILTTPVETYNNSSEVLNEDGTVKSEATPSIPAVDASTLNTTCSHEFGEPEVVQATCYSTGSKTYTCTKCGETMTTTIAKTAHRYYDNPSDADSMESTYHEKCLYNALCHNDRGDVNVAKIGDTEYRTLRQALAAVTDSTPTTITMIANDAIYGHVVTKDKDGKDVYTNNCYTILSGKDITIDLNGHTICNYVTSNAASQVFKVVGSLTITDSSDVNKDGSGYGVIYNDYARDDENVHVGEWWGTPQYNYTTNVITNTGTLTIESGRIYQTAAGSICYAVDNNSTSYNATFNLNGGLVSDAYGTTVRMFCNSATAENIVNVNGGSITTPGSAALWIQLPGSDSSKHMKATVNIAGGTLTANTYAFYDYSYGNGFNNVNYTISGGTLNGNIYSYGANSFTITGGTFNGTISSKKTIDITGGVFNAPPTYFSVKNGNNWTPIEFDETVNNYVLYKDLGETWCDTFTGDYASYYLSYMIKNWFMNNEKLELHTNLTLSYNATLNALNSGETFYIVLNGFNLTAENGVKITVPTGATVVVDGTLNDLFVNTAGVSITGVDNGNGTFSYTGN